MTKYTWWHRLLPSWIRPQHLYEGWFELLALLTPARLWWGILLCLLVLGQLQRWQMTPSISLYGHDLLLAGWLAWWLPKGLSKMSFKTFTKQKPWVRWSIAGIVGLSLASWLLAAVVAVPGVLLRPLLYSFRLAFYAITSLTLVQELKAPGWLTRGGYAMAGLVMAWLGFCQYLLLPDTRFLSILGWDDHLFRLIGPLFDPNFMGAVLVVTWWYLWSIKTMLPQKVLWGCQLLLAIALALTFSRATYLSWLGSGVVFALWHQRKVWQRFMFAGVLGALVVGLVMGIALVWPRPGSEGLVLNRTASISARWQATSLWLSTMTPYQWVLGRGPFVTPTEMSGHVTLASADHANLPDNWIVFLVSGWGVLGTGLWLGVAGYALTALKQRQLLVAVAVSAVAIHGLFNNTIFEPFVWLFLWGGIASALSVRNTKT